MRPKQRAPGSPRTSSESWSSPILSLVTLKFVRQIAVVVLPNVKGGPLARSALNVIELNNMTPDMIASEVGMGPELN